MENVSLKLEPEFLKEIEKIMKNNRYMTKTEFIREAIREKIKNENKEKALKALKENFGKMKHMKTTDEDLERIREEVSQEMMKKHNIKL